METVREIFTEMHNVIEKTKTDIGLPQAAGLCEALLFGIGSMLSSEEEWSGMSSYIEESLSYKLASAKETYNAMLKEMENVQ